ncbi:transposase [Endozoicomonas sp. 8E]|uniref:transposase n=1 Tax=Endozoicomonas sp. 8E TaxID=3035692 RepID=UPI003977C7B9
MVQDKKAFSSGIVEGLNTKIKLTTRKSYGFRTYRCAEIALYHTMGNLPESEMTYRFYCRGKNRNNAPDKKLAHYSIG